MMSAASRRKRWITIFQKRGGDGIFTRLFDNLDAAQRNLLLSTFELREFELPALGSVRDERNWVILTNERIGWGIAGERGELAAEIVRGANPNREKLRIASKLKLQHLDIVTMSGEIHVVEFEAGAPLVGALNVLMNLGQLNRHLNANLGGTELG